MERRRRLAVLAAVAFACLISFAARPALADKATETAARSLQKKAMEEDYLNVDLDKATEHLNQAIAKCGADKCSANLRALLRRDLATVYSAANKHDEALASMTDALKLDGSIQLDANFKTKELEAIYAEAKKGGGGGGGGGGGVPAPPPSGGAPSGDFTHTPAPEQTTNTPLPVYGEYTGSEAVSKVVIKYKGFGMTEWKTLELKKMGNGWGGTIPCVDVQEGSLQYYLQGFNANNDPVATGGDRNNPYKVAIKKTISGEAPHLPGQSAPKQCAEVGECPPDFPGCSKKVSGEMDNLKGAGEDCEEDSQCKSGTCKDDKCTAPPETGGGETGEPRLRRFWVGLAFAMDFPVLSSASDVCRLNGSAQPIDQGYACLDSKGNDYAPGAGSNGVVNNSILSGKSDQVNGGILPGNLRLMASFDYALNANVLIGARFGYTLLTYSGKNTSAFPPLHLEARGTYVIGKDALMKKGIAPDVLLAVGASQFSGKVGVTAFECDDASGNPLGPAAGPGVTSVGKTCPAGASPMTGTPKNVDAWRVGGPVFVAPGGGVRWGLSDRAALSLNLKLVFAFGNGFLFDPSPELAFQFGF